MLVLRVVSDIRRMRGELGEGVHMVAASRSRCLPRFRDAESGCDRMLEKKEERRRRDREGPLHA